MADALRKVDVRLAEEPARAEAWTKARGELVDRFLSVDGTPAAPRFRSPVTAAAMPLALATLSASVGGLGLVARYGLKLADGPSLLVAFPGALAVTYGVTYAAFRVVQGSRGTSAIQASDLEGVPAEILTPIPEGGLGEAAAFVKGERFAGPAREESGRAVPRGTPVTVVRLSGSTLIVKVAAR